MRYKVIRINRKTVSLYIRDTLDIEVRAPLSMNMDDIDDFVNRNTAWIENHMEIMKARRKKREENRLSSYKIEQLKLEAHKMIPSRVNYYSSIMNVEPQNVKITSAATRWGSCSATNNLCFSYRIMLLPIKLIDYIVVHELAHIRVKNHKEEFYNQIRMYMPDYKDRIKSLRIFEKENM